MVHYVQLRAFHAVATHGGFSKAAEALHLTQPAISDQVRKLEQEYGVILFNRRGKTVEPTEIGRRLLAVTQQIFDCLGSAQALLASAASLQTGSLTIAADAPDLAMKLIAPFRRLYPSVRILLGIANSDTCMQRVLARRVDVAVTASSPVDTRLQAVALRREKLVALLPAGRRIKARRIGLAELIGLGLVFREPDSQTQRLLVRELSAAGLSTSASLTVEGREALLAAIAAGSGVGVIAPSEFSGQEGIRIVPIDGLVGSLTEYLVCQADQGLSRLVGEVFRLGREIAESQL